ncbi:hypothetical protein B0H13DRAFT_2123181, partial [Mycena leptocephala]
ACATQRPVASLLILTLIECPTTGRPLWCGECLGQLPIHPLTRAYRVTIRYLLTTCPVPRLSYSTHSPLHPPLHWA